MELKKTLAKLKAGSMSLEEVQKAISTVGGYTLIMTLPSGTNLVRFMVPRGVQPATGTGTLGIYSEGEDKNLSVAMQIALAGLPNL
jgi:hypothetical protein